MKDEFVHFHAIPRYANPVNFYGYEWIDKDWPKGTKLKKINVSKELFEKILKDLKE